MGAIFNNLLGWVYADSIQRTIRRHEQMARIEEELRQERIAEEEEREARQARENLAAAASQASESLEKLSKEITRMEEMLRSFGAPTIKPDDPNQLKIEGFD